MRAVDLQGKGQFRPQALDWQELCRGGHLTVLHTKYVRRGPHDFQKKIHYKSMGAICCHAN